MKYKQSKYLSYLISFLIFGSFFYALPASAAIRCSPATGSSSGTFSGVLSLPIGTAVTDPLLNTTSAPTQKIFTISCLDRSVPGAVPFSATVTVNISPAPQVTPLSISSCSASATSANSNTPVTWTANVTGGTLPYHYVWSGTSPLNGASNPQTVTYTTTGPKTGHVKVTDNSGVVVEKDCSAQITVTDPPQVSNFALVSSPNVNIKFIGQSAASDPVAISLLTPSGFTGSVSLSAFSTAGGSPTTLSLNGVDYSPVSFRFYVNGVQQSSPSLTAGQTIDMKLVSTKLIPAGNYPSAITLKGMVGTEIHSYLLNLNVDVWDPGTQEF